MAAAPSRIAQRLRTAILVALAATVVLRIGFMAVVVDAKDADGYLEHEPKRAGLHAAQTLATGHKDAARGEALRLLQRYPLEAAGYRILGELALYAGDRKTAEARYTQALALDPRDVQSRVWLASVALKRGDLTRAVSLYDHLMRSLPVFQTLGVEALAPLLLQPQGPATLAHALAEHPPWRDEFLQKITRNTEPNDAPDRLLEALESQHGLTREERSAWYERLVRWGRLDEAEAHWRATLPPQAAAGTPPVNGGFEQDVGATPFDWALPRVDGVVPSQTPLPDGQGRGLKIEFYGKRVDFHQVRQLERLNAGRYQFVYRHRLERFETPLGVRWVLRCLLATGADGAVIVAGPLLRGTQGWRTATVEFTVPEHCPAQWLYLELAARIAAERNAYGTVWFDDLAITPAADASPAPVSTPAPGRLRPPAPAHSVNRP